MLLRGPLSGLLLESRSQLGRPGLKIYPLSFLRILLIIIGVAGLAAGLCTKRLQSNHRVAVEVMDVTNKPPEQEWPGAIPAYDFVLPSYTWVIQRVEAADVRIQTLLTFTAAMTVLTTTLAKTAFPMIEFTSVWFILGIGAFLLLVLTGR